MAGHSQFKNIMHRKGRQDKVRSKLFGKLAREITVSAKLGQPDPAFNPRLRAAILAARAENMPKDNIERAIKKSQGGDAESYDEIRYEGYGPGGVAIIVEVLTDNRNRTAGDVRATFTRNGGNMAETGAVSFMFDRVGVVEFDAAAASADQMFEAAIEAGAEDVVSSDSGHEVYAAADSLGEVAKALEAKFGEPRKAALVWKPKNTIALDDEKGEQLLELVGALGGARRRAERLRQFRGLRRADGEDERVTRWRFRRQHKYHLTDRSTTALCDECGVLPSPLWGGVGGWGLRSSTQSPTPPATLRAAGDPPHEGEGEGKPRRS